MPRRRQRRRQSYQHQRRSGSVSLAEFYFYCKQNDEITKEEYEEIRAKLDGGVEHVYWTNKNFAKAHYGFMLFRDEQSQSTTKDYSAKSVCFQNITFSPKQFMDVKHILGERIMVNFPLTDDEVNFYEDLFYDRGSYAYNKIDKPIETKEEFIQLLIEAKVINNWTTDGYNNDWQEFKETLDIIFGDEVPTFKKPKYKINRTGYMSSTNVYHIINVIEKRFNETNYRIVLCGVPKYHDEIKYEIIVVGEDKPTYFNMDEGRLFFKAQGGRLIFLTTDLNEYSGEQLIINLNLFKSMARNIEQVLAPTESIVTRTMYNFYKERVVHFDDSVRDRDLAPKDQAIIARYKKLLMGKRPLKLNGAVITEGKISIDNGLFEMEFPPKFLSVYNNFATIKKYLNNDNVRYNFNRFYEGLLEISSFKIINRDYTRESEYKDWTGCTFKVNGMDINVFKQSNRIKINGIFCRVDDVYHVLTKAICYTDVDEYEKYIREVSHIGVEWKRMISNGVLIKLNNPFFKAFDYPGQQSGHDLLMRFSLLWDVEKRNKVYLSLNNQKYLIKYKGKFKKFFNLPKKLSTITALKYELMESIPDLDDTMILDIVENAVEEAKIVKERGEELVKGTVKEIGAEETEIIVGGNTLLGFVIKGNKTGTKYFIQKVSLAVYKHMDGSWNQRCVVDDHRKQRIYEDRLANRLVNIYNEPAYISTI